MKKNYSKPIALVETFIPNQFVAACQGEWDYEITGTGAKCEAVLDYAPLGAWGSSEATASNQHEVTPHGKVVYFTDAAKARLDAVMEQCFYNTNKLGHNPNSPNSGTELANIVAIASDVMTQGENKATPVGYNLTADQLLTTITSWSHGGGHGVFVFALNGSIVKNQS